MCRLRQICDACELCPRDPPALAAPHGGAAKAARPAKSLSAAQRQELVLKLVGLVAAGLLDECPICMDDVSKPTITPCGHVFCCGCIENWLVKEKAECPLCRTAVYADALVDAPADATQQAIDAPAGQVRLAAPRFCIIIDKVKLTPPLS